MLLLSLIRLWFKLAVMIIFSLAWSTHCASLLALAKIVIENFGENWYER